MANTSTQNEEAVIIFLDGQGLNEAVYQTYDLSTLEDLLIEQIEPHGIGELDGHETGPTQTTIYMYGPDAEALFSRVQPILASYPLCQNSRAVVRHGGPGSSQREVFPFR
ncbi:MAG TPA: hypothetical protein VGG18_07235 [Granulicella sp.]|jgi:hypothetical protein